MFCKFAIFENVLLGKCRDKSCRVKAKSRRQNDRTLFWRKTIEQTCYTGLFFEVSCCVSGEQKYLKRASLL